MPDLTYLGVPIKPATPDLTAQVTQILDFKPGRDHLLRRRRADCWNLVAGLGRLGWTPEQIPLVLSGSCVDFEAMTAAGDLAKGIYFVGRSRQRCSTIRHDRRTRVATSSRPRSTRPSRSSTACPTISCTRASPRQGFSVMMSLWELASRGRRRRRRGHAARRISAAFAATDGEHRSARRRCRADGADARTSRCATPRRDDLAVGRHQAGPGRPIASRPPT